MGPDSDGAGRRDFVPRFPAVRAVSGRLRKRFCRLYQPRSPLNMTVTPPAHGPARRCPALSRRRSPDMSKRAYLGTDPAVPEAYRRAAREGGLAPRAGQDQ